MKEAVLGWSGGKDAALALEATEGVSVLLTTFGEDGRTKTHGVRRELIEAQGRALGLPVVAVELPDRPSNEEYESRMRDTLGGLAEGGTEKVVFGDILLEDVRSYREKTTPDRLETAFPLWGKDTDELANEAARRLEAVTVCVEEASLGRDRAGEEVDEGFLNRLPASVDPCGENGEFHTFVADSPSFGSCVPYELGEVTEREMGDTRYFYQDIETG